MDARRNWDEYQRAYEIALERCNTDVAPWYVVPADRKWYRNLAIDDLGSVPAQGRFDVERERNRPTNSSHGVAPLVAGRAGQ